MHRRCLTRGSASRAKSGKTQVFFSTRSVHTHTLTHFAERSSGSCGRVTRTHTDTHKQQRRCILHTHTHTHTCTTGKPFAELERQSEDEIGAQEEYRKTHKSGRGEQQQQQQQQQQREEALHWQLQLEESERQLQVKTSLLYIFKCVYICVYVCIYICIHI